MDEIKKEDRRTVTQPHKLIRDEETGYSKVDPKQSESFVLLEAAGQPRVVYAKRANKYFRDLEATKEFPDAEIVAMGLPATSAIKAARERLFSELMAQGVDFTKDEVYDATSPQTLKPRADLDAKLLQPTPEELLIARLNRSSLVR